MISLLVLSASLAMTPAELETDTFQFASASTFVLPQSAHPEDRVAIRETKLEWRYTAVGWRQVPVDQIVLVKVDRVPPAEPFSVHPITWTVLLLLAVSGVAAWASDEWDWARVADSPS